jgi:hypothetical protein
MSDQPTTPAPAMPPLMSPERARDIGRLYQALSEQFDASGGTAQAARELQRAQWWLTYSITLPQAGSKEA